MKRYISNQDRKYYTDMQEIILAIGGANLKYKWLISDIDAIAIKGNELSGILKDKSQLLLSNQDLLCMLNDYHIQWIWAVFSAIPENVSDDEIGKYPIPCANDNEEIYKENVAIIQHPLADIEIVAEDFSSVLIVSKDESVAEAFKELFPKCKTNY